MRRVTAYAILVLAAATLAIRLPTLIGNLDAKAARNAERDTHSRQLASADSLDISNEFVSAALSIVPDHATFTVALPRRGDPAIPSDITYLSLPGYMLYVLLPRREVAGRTADYVLCYACYPRALKRPVRWVWSSGRLRIGRFTP